MINPKELKRGDEVILRANPDYIYHIVVDVVDDDGAIHGPFRVWLPTIWPETETHWSPWKGNTYKIKDEGGCFTNYTHLTRFPEFIETCNP